MSPKRSKRSSPIKSANESATEISKGVAGQKLNGSGSFKLRLKVKTESPSKTFATEENLMTSTTGNTSDTAKDFRVNVEDEIADKDIEKSIQTIIDPVVIERKIPKIKLNFSRSTSDTSLNTESLKGSSETANVLALNKKKQRGRPKKDKTAVKAAALAASQPNDAESEEKRERRRAAEEKIKSIESISLLKVGGIENVNTFNDNTKTSNEEQNNLTNEQVQVQGKRRRGRKPKIPVNDLMTNDQQQTHSEGVNCLDQEKKRRRRRKPRGSSDEFIDITEGQNSNNQTSRTNHNTNQTTLTVFNPHENEFVQRSKTFLNIAMQHDAYNLSLASTSEPFKSLEDAVDRILPFHLGIHAGQYTTEELDLSLPRTEEDKNELFLESFVGLQDRYRSLVHSLASKKVTTELLLLEQRLCLEEEKFLLVKLKNEYAARFLKSSGSGSLGGSGSNIGTGVNNINFNTGSNSTMNSVPNSSRPTTPYSSITDHSIQ